MSLQTITLTRGLPASGKTTWAKAWVLEDPAARARVNRDDLRAMLFVKPTYEWHQEQQVTAVQREAVKALVAAGCDVVCDDTNLRPKYVREWQRFARAHGADVEIREFPIDVEDAIRRDAERTSPVGEQIIRNMAGKFTRKGALLPLLEDVIDEEPAAETYTPDPSLPHAIIVDIDGTVALKHPDRDIYDLTRVHMDLRNEPVIEAVQAAKRDGLAVVYCSGRDASARAETATWIAENVEVPGELWMRGEGDRRKDSIVKRELFDTHIRERYNVRYVLDDRQQVVDMWRRLGLTCLQVAPGDF